MHFSRRSRLVTVIFSLCVLLFGQAALARYACPAAAVQPQAAAVAEPMTAPSEMGLPCAAAMSMAMDTEQPGLCHAHCQDEQRSADNPQIPTLASLIQLGAVLTLAPRVPPDNGQLLQTPLLKRTTAPPLAVRHCCFRT